MNLDVNLFYFINKTIGNPFFDFLMPLISILGNGEVVFIIAVLCLLYGLKKKEKKMAGILILAGLAPAYYAVNYLKSWIARPRPFMVLTDVRLIGKPGDFSFPSGHATIAFMAAFILSKYFKRGGAVFYSLAVLVCIARVYVGAHYITDVIAGALLGTAIGYALITAAKN